MPFYYLRYKDSPKPKTEKDFKYLVYLEKETTDYISIPDEPNSKFLAHDLTEKPTWHVEDDIIDIDDRNKVTIARFEKIYDTKELQVWKNVPI